MLKVFESLKKKDENAINEYALSSDVLMEMAAKGVAEKIIEIAYSNEPFYQDLLDGFFYNIAYKKTVIIVCGPSDNGGDGLALSRLLQDYFCIITVLPYLPKSQMCILQKKRLDLLSIDVNEGMACHEVLKNKTADILVDAVFGTGFAGDMRKEYQDLLEEMNQLKALKIALDVPSGLDILGVPSSCFRADITICIGALRTQLYSSLAKDYIGHIVLKRLPLPVKKYEADADIFLLEKSDMHLPYRKVHNVNKGSFGSVAVMQGERKGASQLVAKAALTFGAGLVTLVGKDVSIFMPDLMESQDIPDGITCIAMGSGAGRENKWLLDKFLLYVEAHSDVSLVLDADICYYDEVASLLRENRHMVCTPHPKEFQSLLRIAMGMELSIEEIRRDKLALMRAFCKKHPHAVLLLKDSNSFIGYGKTIFINDKGSPALAKAGTGDVLTGLIASLLSQGYEPLQSTITASLSHALVASAEPESYSLLASTLIEKIACM